MEEQFQLDNQLEETVDADEEEVAEEEDDTPYYMDVF